jgi:hypothetical protein
VLWPQQYYLPEGQDSPNIRLGVHWPGVHGSIPMLARS